MPLRAWIESRVPTAPEALKARLSMLIDQHPEWEELSIADAMLAAGECLLQEVLNAPAKDRRTALDLLTADACVTYAFEAGAAEPGQLAEVAMRRIALVASRG